MSRCMTGLKKEQGVHQILSQLDPTITQGRTVKGMAASRSITVGDIAAVGEAASKHC